MKVNTRVNHQIRARELRVITDQGENLGVIKLEDALKEAESRGLDLIEVSPAATPPVAKITDYGRWQYQESKKQKHAREKAHHTETKSLQVKPGTGEHDLALKARKASEFLKDGHRVKVELYLRGRAKYMDREFLKTRLERLLNLITEEYHVAAPAERGPKGLTMIIERSKRS